MTRYRHIEFEPNKKLGEGGHFDPYQRMWYMVKAYLVKDEGFKTVV